MTRLSPVVILFAAACSGGDDLTGPAADDCGPSPWFTELPVSLSDVQLVAAYGGLAGPGHTLPTAHTGFMLRTEGATVRSPTAMQITRIRRVRYLVSPNRQGVEDYATEFQVCKQVSGWFGHITSLATKLRPPEGSYGGCQTYSTATETVESCSATPDGLTVTAGEQMGLGGHSIALGLMGLDFGLRDSRENHFYVSPQRFGPDMFTAICPWDQFVPALRDQLYAIFRDPARPGVIPSGEPRCGTMEVDVANTAKGVWVVQGTNPPPGNETDYVTLANYPYRPQDNLALSIGPTSLGAWTGVVARQTSGRVNRAFDQVTNDGLVYCYGLDTARPTSSWFIRLTGNTTLQMRLINHGLGASPCLADPTTWSMTGAVALVR